MERTIRHGAEGRRRWRRIVAGGIVATALLTACGSSSKSEDAGATTTSTAKGATSPLGEKKAATGTPVKIGFVTDGQNTATDQTIELDIAAGSAKYLNEYKGGLGGHPIELVTCETKLDPSKATDCGNEMVRSKVAAVVFGTTGVSEAIWTPLHEAKIPAIMHSPGRGRFDEDAASTFVLSDPGGSLINTPIGVAKANGKKKVTAIVIDVPAAISSYSGDALAKWEKAGIALDLIRVPPGTADMTAQLGKLKSGDPGAVEVVGNDTFCIGAYNAMIALGVKAPISAVAFCVTDVTRKAMPASFLKGMTLAAVAPIGDTGPKTALIRAVSEAYGHGWNLSTGNPFLIFQAFNALESGAGGIKGAVTPEAVIAAMKSAPEQDLVGSGGVKFRCNGKANPEFPAVCVRATLVTVLDDTAHPGEYKAVGGTPIPS